MPDSLPVPLRVLLVEDNPAEARETLAMLEKALPERVQTLVVHDILKLQEAVSGQAPFHAVLLDLNLPGIVGLEGLKLIQKSFPRLPIIFLTATDDPILAYLTLREGVQDYLVKGSFNPAQLQRTIGFAIERHKLNQRVADYAERLAASEARLRSILESNPDGIVAVDGSGTVQFANAAACKLLGVPEDKLVGAPWSHAVPELDSHHEIDIATPTGHRRAAEISQNASVLDGQPVVLISLRDVTERRQLLEHAVRAQKMQAVEQLMDGVAHEFGNIMAITRMSAEMCLVNPALPESAKKGLNAVVQGCERAAVLVRQMTAFQQAGSFQPTGIELNAQFGEFESALRSTVPENIAFTLSRPPEPLPVYADPFSLRQAVLNLVQNAREAMPEGGSLSVVLEATTAKLPRVGRRRCASIAVSDTGRGIPAESRDRVFEPFFTTKDPNAGPGLGLAAVFHIIEQHGGSIALTSEVGKGTTVRLLLPLQE